MNKPLNLHATVDSPVPEIRSIKFYRLSSISGAARVIATESGVVVLDNDGQIFTTILRANAFYNLEREPWTSDLLRALVRVGEISPAAADKHEAACEEVKTRADRRLAAEIFLGAAQQCGIKLNPGQRMAAGKIAKGKG